MYYNFLMPSIPFYDPTRSYEDNYEIGPFGVFADSNIYKQDGKPQCNFLGQNVYLPLGIPAGPLINSRFVKAAFEKGWDICVYKTVRSTSFPCHPHPNILAVTIEGDLTPEKMKKPLIANNNYHEPLSITNSFGVPSKEPAVWQEDVKKAISHARKGQMLVLSFMGTVRENQTQKEFIDDYILAARLSKESGAKILEVNLSCPNIGNEGLVCYNLDVTRKVCEGIGNVFDNTAFIVKVGYYSDYKELETLARIVNDYANSIAAINTLQVEVRDKEGNPALPGKNRLRSGICGASIKWAGIDMVKRLKKIREENKLKYSIEGVGGVMKVDDYIDYKKAGADSVMSATGAMWNPLLAQQVKKRNN